MTYQSYTRGIRLIFAFLVPLFLLDQIGKESFAGQHQYLIILALLYLSVRIVTLYLLFFSIYAFLAKIENVRRLESPAIFVVISTIFVLLSFGPPIAIYLTSLTHQTDFKYSEYPAQKIKSDAMNVNIVPLQRRELVRNYYLDTGERLTYLDGSNRSILFSPDDMALKLYQATANMKLAFTNLRITALILIGLLVVSALCFAIYLWFRFPHKAIQ